MSTTRAQRDAITARKNREAAEYKQMIKMDPIAAVERMQTRLSLELDQQLQRVNGAVSLALNRALVDCVMSYKRLCGFSKALADAARKPKYEIRWLLPSRIGNDHLRHRLQALRGTVESPRLGNEELEVLAAVKAATPPPGVRIFEGGQDFSDYLCEHNLKEDHPNSEKFFPQPTARLCEVRQESADAERGKD